MHFTATSKPCHIPLNVSEVAPEPTNSSPNIIWQNNPIALHHNANFIYLSASHLHMHMHTSTHLHIYETYLYKQAHKFAQHAYAHTFARTMLELKFISPLDPLVDKANYVYMCTSCAEMCHPLRRACSFSNKTC